MCPIEAHFWRKEYHVKKWRQLRRFYDDHPDGTKKNTDRRDTREVIDPTEVEPLFKGTFRDMAEKSTTSHDFQWKPRMRCIHFEDHEDPMLIRKAWDGYYAAIALQRGVPGHLQLAPVEPDHQKARWAKPKQYPRPAWTRDELSREQRLEAIRVYRAAVPDPQSQYRRQHRPYGADDQ